MIKMVVLVSGIIHAQPVCIVLPELEVNLVFHLLQLESRILRLFALQEHFDLRLWVEMFLIVVNVQLAILAQRCVLSRLFVHLATTVLKNPLCRYLVLLALSALVTALLQERIAVLASEVDSVLKLLKQQSVVFVIKCIIVLRNQLLQFHNIVAWVQQLILLEKFSQSVMNAQLEDTVVSALNFHYPAHQVNTIQNHAVRRQLIA
jgi:hypothetical protein